MTEAPYLTPSELVFLHGELFASKAGIVNSINLITMDYKVQKTELVNSILGAALLAGERAGGLALTMRKEKAMLGLTTKDVVYVEPRVMIGWPGNSAEANLPQIAANLAQRGKNDVENVIYVALQEDSSFVEQAVVDRVCWGLAQRGLLEVEEKRTLKIFVSHAFHVPPATFALMQQFPVQDVQQMLAYTQSTRPELWNAMTKSIKKAIQARTPQTDNDFSD